MCTSSFNLFESIIFSYSFELSEFRSIFEKYKGEFTNEQDVIYTWKSVGEVWVSNSIVIIKGLEIFAWN